MSLTLDINGKPTLTIAETSWSDYAFDKNHKRQTFEEQERDLRKNKHLNGIASEKEIIENGLDITGTMKGLTLNMEKTKLDVIDLHKRLVVSEQNNNALQKQIDELKKEIKSLKK